MPSGQIERPGWPARRAHDIPTARIAATLTRPIDETGRDVLDGSQPQSANNQKREARNALARSRPRPPMERRVSPQADDPADQQNDTDEDHQRAPLPPGALCPSVVRVPRGVVRGADDEQREGKADEEAIDRETVCHCAGSGIISFSHSFSVSPAFS